MNTKDKILVVDDKGINRYMLGEIFSEQYEVIEASGGQRALELIEALHDELAIVLLDVIMPGIDGFDVLKFMNEEGYIDTLPVVIVTDDTSEKTSVKAFEQNASDMVIKPFEPHVIRRRVQNIIELYAYRAKEAQSESAAD